MPKAVSTKNLLSLSFALCISAPSYAQSITANWHTWMGVMRGEVGTPDAVANFEEVGEPIPNFATRGFAEPVAQPGFWIDFKHDISYLPQIRIAHDEIDYWGESTVELRYDSVQQPADLNDNGTIEDGEYILWGAFDFITTSLEIDVNDITFYYQVKEGNINWDAGLTLRQLDGDFFESAPPYVIPSFDLTTGDLISQRPGEVSRVTPVDIVLPLIYTRAKMDLSFMKGLYVEASANIIGYEDAQMLDFNGEIGYLFDKLPYVDIGLTAGVRFAQLKADDLNGLYADADMSGFHGGLLFQLKR